MLALPNRVLRSWDEQSYTILATDRHIPFHPQAPKMVKVEGQALREFAQCHESKYRRLTIRECARIQTFPDDYEFVYTNMRNAYKMIGNAVPVFIWLIGWQRRCQRRFGAEMTTTKKPTQTEFCRAVLVRSRTILIVRLDAP